MTQSWKSTPTQRGIGRTGHANGRSTYSLPAARDTVDAGVEVVDGEHDSLQARPPDPRTELVSVACCRGAVTRAMTARRARWDSPAQLPADDEDRQHERPSAAVAPSRPPSPGRNLPDSDAGRPRSPLPQRFGSWSPAPLERHRASPPLPPRDGYTKSLLSLFGISIKSPTTSNHRVAGSGMSRTLTLSN
jgi:hypothetical protein